MKLRLLFVLNFVALISLAQVRFDQLNGPSGGYIAKIEKNSSDELFALSNSKIYKSTDGGGSWSALTTFAPGNVGVVDMIIDNSNKIYVAGKSKIWTSTNGGSTWSEITPNATYNPSRRLLKSPTVANSLFVIGYTGSVYGLQRSTDDGLTWSNVYSSQQVNGYTIDNGGNVFIATNTGNGVLKSTNNGTGFSSFIQNITAGSTPTDMVTNPFSGMVYVRMYASHGVWGLANGSSTWTQSAADSPITFSNSGSNFALWTPSNGNGIFIRENGYLYYSSNSIGGPWTLLNNNGLPSSDNPITVFATTTNFYVGLERTGVWASNNGGAAWAASDVGIYHYNPMGFFMTSAGVMLVSSGGSVIKRSTDGGGTWTTKSVCSCGISSFVQLTNGNILGIGSNTMLSADNGNTFPTTQSSGVNLSRAYRVDDTHIYALGPSETDVYFTSNLGVVWSNLNITGLPSQRRIDNLAVLSNFDIILTVTLTANPYATAVYRVPSGSVAASLLSVPGMTSVRAGDAVGTKIFINGRNSSNQSVMAVSSNGGSNWTSYLSEEVNDFRVVTDEIFFGRGNSSFIYTNDAGVTWTSMTIDNEAQSAITSNDTYLIDAYLNTNKYAYVGISNSPFYASSTTIALPTKPSNFSVIGRGSNPVVLQWTSPSNELDTEFFIERSASGLGDFVQVGEEGAYDRYFYDNTTNASTTYDYRIRAVNAAGERYSDQISVTTNAECVLNIPDNRSWTGTVGGGPTNTGIIIRKLNDQTYSISDLTGNYTDATITTIISGYFFQNCTEPYIFGDNNLQPNGNGTWNSVTNTITLKWQVDATGPVSATTPKTLTLTLNTNDPTPTAPTLSGYILTDNSIKLEWVPGNFNKSYTIERSTSSLFTSPTTLGPISEPTTSFIDNGPFTATQTYYYRIRATNANAVPLTSPNSNTKSILFAKPYFVLSSTTVSATYAHSPSFAWSDIDNDADEDLFVSGFNFGGVGEAPASLLFENNNAGNFVKHTNKIPALNSISANFGDIDNNGLLDLVFTTFSDVGGKKLYHNDGGLNFSEVYVAALDGVVNGDGVSPSAWVDVDNDGDLDLFHIGGGQHILLNNGTGSLTEAATTGNALLTATDDFTDFSFADYDKDHDMDVIMSTDDNIGPKLFKNDGTGKFSLVAVASFATETASFNTVSWGDYDNDQDLDLFIGTQGAASRLFRNDGNDVFFKVATLANSPTENISADSYGSAWGDVDNDGDLDLVVGHAGTTNAFYINQGSGTWSKVDGELLVSLANFNVGMAFADYDKNGLLDLMAGRFIFAGGEGAPSPDPIEIALMKNNTGSTGNYLLIKLIGTASNKQAVGATVKVAITGKNLLRYVTTHNGTAAQPGQFLHFGLGTATTATVTVEWPSGVIQTYTNQPVNTLMQITEDAVGPVGSTFVPAKAATAVSISTPLAIELNESSTAVATKKIYVYRSADLVTPVFSADVTTATKTVVGQGHRYQFTITPALLATTSYVVQLDAGAFVDVFNNPSLAITGSSWTFATADDIAPIITFTPAATIAKGFGTANPTATVTDNVGVTSVVVKIRKIGGSTYSDLVATAGASNTWTIALSEATHFDGNGTEFYIEAKDAANNLGRSPASGTHKIRLSYTGIQASIPGNFIGIGGQKSSWKAFSIPFELTSPANAVTAVFDEFEGLENTKDYRLITYGSATAWSEYPSFSVLQRGKGYFINFKTDPGIIDLPIELTAPTNDRSNLFSITLQPGWNMIGNPYLSAVNWSDVKTFNSAVSGAGSIGNLLKFSAGSYPASSSQVLDAYEGAFVNNTSSSSITFTIPFAGQTSLGGRKQTDELGTDINQDSWMTSIKLQQKDLGYDLAAVGMAPDASLTIDEYDAVPPPRFFDYLEVGFEHPEYFQKRFTRDIVPTQKAYQWEFNVSSNIEGDANLYWDNTALEGVKELWLLDLSRQVLVNMKETGKYSFNPKESANFRVYFGENLKIAPEKVILGKAYPNPTSGLTSLTFSLPESGGLNQNVSLEIIDAMGRPVGTIAQGRFNPGYHELSWNANEFNNGFYTYRLTVNNVRGRTTHVNKLIIK
jgi:hypothetical protein